MTARPYNRHWSIARKRRRNGSNTECTQQIRYANKPSTWLVHGRTEGCGFVPLNHLTMVIVTPHTALAIQSVATPHHLSRLPLNPQSQTSRKPALFASLWPASAESNTQRYYDGLGTARLQAHSPTANLTRQIVNRGSRMTHWYVKSVLIVCVNQSGSLATAGCVQ